MSGRSSNPKVSLVMSVYNGQRYLREAVESILNQSFRDFEFIIVDDGSTDGTWRIVNSYDDARLVLVRNERNIGLTRSLNKGLKLARGEYIARMDADDISHPERLENQVAFLEQNGDVGLVGVWYEKIDNKGRVFDVRKLAVIHDEILRYLLHENHFAHSAVMFRRHCLDKVGLYGENLPYAQDYDLWLRISRHFKLANLPVVLHQWRHNIRSGISLHKRAEQLEARRIIRERFLHDFVTSEPQALEIIEGSLGFYPDDDLLFHCYEQEVANRFPLDHAEHRFAIDILRCLRAADGSPYTEMARWYEAQGAPFLAFLCRLRSLELTPCQPGLYQRIWDDLEDLEKIRTPKLTQLQPSTCTVSVIMPTYNRHKIISESIESVLGQTFQDFELVIVNDGGSDEVEKVIRAFNSPKIRYFKIEHSGLGAALNKGLEEARGRYIAYLDDDDIYYPHHLETLLDAAIRLQAKLVYSKSRLVKGYFEDGHFVKMADLGTYSQPFSKEQLHQWCIISTLNVLHSKEALKTVGVFNPRLVFSMDWELWIRFSQHYPLYHVDVFTGEYRKWIDNMSLARRYEGTFFEDLIRAYYASGHGLSTLAFAAWKMGRKGEAEEILRQMLDGFLALSPRHYAQMFELILRERRGVYATLRDRLFEHDPAWFLKEFVKRFLRGNDRGFLALIPLGFYLRMASFVISHRQQVADAAIWRMKARGMVSHPLMRLLEVAKSPRHVLSPFVACNLDW